MAIHHALTGIISFTRKHEVFVSLSCSSFHMDFSLRIRFFSCLSLAACFLLAVPFLSTSIQCHTILRDGIRSWCDIVPPVIGIPKLIFLQFGANKSQHHLGIHIHSYKYVFLSLVLRVSSPCIDAGFIIVNKNITNSQWEAYILNYEGWKVSSRNIIHFTI